VRRWFPVVVLLLVLIPVAWSCGSTYSEDRFEERVDELGLSEAGVPPPIPDEENAAPLLTEALRHSQSEDLGRFFELLQQAAQKPRCRFETDWTGPYGAKNPTIAVAVAMMTRKELIRWVRALASGESGARTRLPGPIRISVDPRLLRPWVYREGLRALDRLSELIEFVDGANGAELATYSPDAIPDEGVAKLSAGTLVHANHALRSRVKYIACVRMTRVILAARKHRRATGHWPGGLQELAPLFPDGIPLDPYSGELFRYDPARRISSAAPGIQPIAFESPMILQYGPYSVVEELGSGGMGTVYLAERDSERVALKVVHDHLLAEPGVLKRFQREVEGPRRVRRTFWSWNTWKARPCANSSRRWRRFRSRFASTSAARSPAR